MADRALVEELASVVGSRIEATWISEHEADPGAARQLARRRAAGEPLQYVLGRWPFRQLELVVDSRALIPRPETEQVVEQALARWRETAPGRDGLRVLDLGTGTGAIGLSLASELVDEAVVDLAMLTDQSPAALALAGENARRLGIDVTLALGWWGDAVAGGDRGRFHLLVSNPPYVASSERPLLDPVLDYEPEEALVGVDGRDGTPGFGDVEIVLEHAVWLLAHGGVVAVEMAEHQVPSALALAATLGFQDPREFVDLAGHRRGITALRS